MGRDLLARLPAVEGIAVVERQELQPLEATGPRSRTGAEKPRSSDGTGGAGDIDEAEGLRSPRAASARASRVGAASSPASRVASSVPSGPISPMATGMTSGSLVGWPGVGAVAWLRVSS